MLCTLNRKGKQTHKSLFLLEYLKILTWFGGNIVFWKRLPQGRKKAKSAKDAQWHLIIPEYLLWAFKEK